MTEVSDHVNLTKLMHILITWHERRLISKLYMDQNAELKLDQRETRSVNIGRKLDNDAICHQVYSICTVNTLQRKLLKGLENSK